MINHRWIGLTLAATALVAVGSNARSSDDHGLRLQARLAGFQEAPSISTTGRGSFRARLSEDGTAINFQLAYSDLEGTASVAHIHVAQKGVNGGVAAFLCGGAKPACPPSGKIEGEITAADVSGPAGQGIAAGEFEELVRALRAGNGYANVHSSKFPGGEIRGQIRTDGDDD